MRTIKCLCWGYLPALLEFEGVRPVGIYERMPQSLW